ncbi:hypothetical protein G9A89_005057 [Geosiphon pyriformis]|nr:hypothetical protein G9A89_005057 [Geosiphon pyriformis]
MFTIIKLESKETESEQERTIENKEEMATAYIAKIPKFTGENNDTSSQEWLDKVQKAEDANDQFIAGLKDKLIKKVCPHAPEGLATAIRHAKNYEMAIEETNHTKLVNLAIEETSSAAEEKIDQLTKKIPTAKQLLSACPTAAISTTSTNPTVSTAIYTTIPNICPKIGKVVAPESNSSNNTIPPAQIAQNANLSDIFSFEFEANESPFLLSNTAINEQKVITVMYTKTTIEGKFIQLILDSRSVESIITYQLMQQLNQNVDRPVQTVIVTADSMKKTPVGEIDNFLFTIDGITIPVKVLVMDASQY